MSDGFHTELVVYCLVKFDRFSAIRVYFGGVEVCRAPDWTTRVLYKCPCGDQPVSIPDERAAETYLDGAFWCSTVMSLLNFDGTVKYVWNPFSLQQLKAKLGSFDVYLECVASKNNGDCTAPTDEIFRKQQIPLLSVYQRCLSNYQEMTWDQGTHVLYNRTLQRAIKLDMLIPEVPDTLPGSTKLNISAKLLEVKTSGFDNTAVLDFFLGGTQASDYFKYSVINEQDPGSGQVDACLTFSGPAKIADTAISQPFIACLDSYANRSGCDIPHMLWSGRSTNKVPVATQHTLSISDPATRLRIANGEMEATQANVLAVLDKLEKGWTGDGLKITIFSADGDLLHQYADCVMQGPMGSMTLTPGPDSVEKVVWSRSSDGTPSRLFELPCSGERLTQRDGISRDDVPPFTCGTYARRAVVKHFLRVTYGGEKENNGAKDAVVKAVLALINRTRAAWTFKENFMCTCPDGTTGWNCCETQKECATDPCPCPGGFSVKASVACCTSVCGGLAGTGIMEPFSKIRGETLASDLLAGVGSYLKNDIWTSTDPWLKFDPRGAASYEASWKASQFEVADAGLFDAANPVVYYDEITFPFKVSFWEHCAGLLQQVIWTMPVDRDTGRPKIPTTKYDPITGKSHTPNMTYTEEFIQSLTAEAYKKSPLFWHYNVRHFPSRSEVCKRKDPRRPKDGQSFPVGKNAARKMGFASMTLGGLGGADCYCGWWFSETECRIPDSLCAALVQILGFRRVCIDQSQIYNSISDHQTVLAAIDALRIRQPDMRYPCPSLQISEHWGLMNASTGGPFDSTTDAILHEGVSGFRAGNIDWVFAVQTEILNPNSRVDQAETPTSSAALDCDSTNSSIVDHFIDELFPAAKGVRQSMPQSYCTRYGIELARLTVYKTAGLTSAVGEQQGVADRWKKRCQFKLEELAVCNSFHVLDATGGPTATSQCPFTLSIVASLSRSYAVTPGCLLVVWDTPGENQDGIYDPCICVSCANTPNIDVPAQLTSLCKLESFQTLVAKDVIPGESAVGVHLGSGSFRTLMDKPGFLQINSPDITHWALHTSVRDADLIHDWWPDEWRHPVGYHVTPGCSLPNDAHWRTFDASWRWDSATEQMRLSRDETNDPLQSRNAFGAAGVCRTNNFGMPITTLNTMAICTIENADARADPMVPPPASSEPWVDGSENCAGDHTSTPWDVDRSINPPRQWTVGTLHLPSDDARLKPLLASEWGAACGPYPLRTCHTAGDCGPGLKCLRSSGGDAGVCGNLQTKSFECTAHLQCPEERMCAGDGICVDGVWHIRNEAPEPIAFRSHSQDCSTGVSLDTWGTSAAETIPDILNASGMCSYRSWFENRRMAQRNSCMNTDACLGFSGLQPWNFTSPRQKRVVGESAFNSKVLKVNAHVCDRDYHYMEGFESCTPSENHARMYLSANGKSTPAGAPLQTDTRTQTYRPDEHKTLPLIHHMDNTVGPTYGFTGIPLTYAELRLGAANPRIKPCSSMRTCGFQPSFRVNGRLVTQRLVLDNGKSRGYLMQDLLQCGVFGYQSTGGNGLCRIDLAVAPLAGLLLLQHANLLNTAEYGAVSDLSESYPPDNVLRILEILNSLPTLLLTNMVGGRPTTLREYVDRSEVFVGIYSALQQIDKPTYAEAGAGAPRQIYKLTQFGAFEVPFVWWYKCAWLAGFSLASDKPISSAQCSWREDMGNAAQPTAFGSYDNRVAGLLGLQEQQTRTTKKTTLQTLLVKLPGIVTKKMMHAANLDYKHKRDEWADLITANALNGVSRMCFGRKEFIPEHGAASDRYQTGILSQIYSEGVFDTETPYRSTDNKTEVCRGNECLRSAAYATPMGSNSDFQAQLTKEMKAATVTEQTVALGLELPDGDNVALQRLFTSAPLSSHFLANLHTLFKNEPNGCDEIVTATLEHIPLTCMCSKWSACTASIQTQMLEKAKINLIPSESIAAELDFGNKGKEDVCGVMSGANSEGKCLINDMASGLTFDQTTITSLRTPVGTLVETYAERRWDCVRLTCDYRSPDFNNRMVPASFTSWSSRTVEKVVIDVFEHTQPIPAGDSASTWKDAKTEADEMQCDNNPGRMQYQSEVVPEQKGGYMRVDSCKSTCPIAVRVLAIPTTRQFKVIKAAYYVNDTLTDEVELYPCISGHGVDENIRATTLGDIKSQHSYRQSTLDVDLKLCTSFFDESELPVANSIPLAYTRDATVRNSTGLAKLKNTMAAINRVLLAINTQFTDDLCVTDERECSNVDQNVGKTLKIVDISQMKRTARCQQIKTDPVFGCTLWPGESTISTKVSSRYTCPSKYDFNTFEANRTCLTDLATDPCSSIIPIFRRSDVKGRTLMYELTITTPTCTAGPVAQCTLADEALTIAADPNAGCPGTNASSNRYKAYNTMRKFNRLFTEVIRAESFRSESGSSSLNIDHLFVSLDKGFACSSSSSYTCAEANKVPVQIRRRLWACLDCPLTSDWQCIGQHNCLMQTPKLSFDSLSALAGWDTLSAASKSFLVDTDSDISAVVPAIEWIVTRLSTLALPDVRLSYERVEFMDSYSQASQFVYNPIPILSYEKMMQRNSQTCNSTGTIPDFSKCSYDGHRRNLISFINRHYKIPDGAIIMPGDTLQWRVSRSQFTSNSIPHWSAATGKRGMFLTDLLSDAHCLNGSMTDNACYTHSDSNGSLVIDVLNPGMLGSFEPMIGCDTETVSGQRVVSAMCVDCIRDPVNEYMQLEDDTEMTCPLSYQTVAGVTVDSRAESNLCYKTPAYDSKCGNKQGMLGQATYDGNPATDVYGKITAGIGNFMPVGLHSNMLFKGQSPGPGKLANLILHPDDIGGHSIRMVLAETRSGGFAMSITGLPLSSYSSGLSDEAFGLSATSADLEWMDVMDMDGEIDSMRTLYPPPSCSAWDCPLRRRAFYMGENEEFRPLVPDPLRTQVMYGSRAHPTQKAFRMPQTLSQSTATRVLSAYSSSNGFCACTEFLHCVNGCQTDEEALRGEWVASSVVSEGAKCAEQLDWPYAGGALRDDATFPRRWTTLAACGVLDRLPAFRYRYKNLKQISRSTNTTLDRGGACHMGWPAITAGPLVGCYILTSESADTYMCPAFLQPKAVTRMRAKTVQELLSSPSRPRLTDCSSPPTYRINSSTTTPSEVSYGQLKRIEASRVLANDLRRRLCGNATECKPASSWSMGSFWTGVYSKNAFDSIPTGNGENTSLWEAPWVACKQTNGEQTCDGTIPRKDWITGNRPQLCLDTLLSSPFANDLAQDVNVCDLDEGMDRFCRTIQDARYQIFEANCLYSGQCRQRLFFYQPSTYAVDNGEFVRSTVQRFYNSTVAGACVPDQDTAQAILNNAPNLEKCAAVQLNVLADCIQVVRVIVGALVELVYYNVQLMMTVFKLIGANKGAQQDAVVTELNALLKLIQNKFKLIFEQIGDLIYKILFEGPMGDWLISMISAICHFVEWLFSKVVYVVLCWVQFAAVAILRTYAVVFVTIIDGITFGAVSYLYAEIDAAVIMVETNIPCTPQTMWSCSLHFKTSANRTTILPMPTRCWAGVEPGISSLACTAADTCMTSDFNKVICGACQAPATSSMIRFGCDTLTKLCTCHVFPSDITSCDSHEECTMEGGGVGCRYVDSYLQPSYGSIPCLQCPHPTCLITDGSGVGKCSCLLRPVPNQACSEPGQAVSPNAAQLCLVSVSRGMGSTSAYTQNYRELANAPCMILNQAQTYCMQVYISGSATPLVVGLSLLHTGRRLLAWNHLIGDGSVFLDSDASSWEGRGEPCRSLVHANATQLGIVDKYTRGECWRWYSVGMHLVTEANMTGVNPFFLVSWHDTVSTMLDKGALVEILAKIPKVIHRVLLHSETVQSAYIVLTYWLAILPKEDWTNQTILDNAKRFFANYTSDEPIFIESQAPTMDNQTSIPPQPHRRRLLSDEEAIGLPSRRASVSANTVITTDISSQTVYEWSQGPYSWPPNYIYWQQKEQSCAMVSTALNSVKNGLDSTILFYQNPIPKAHAVVWPSIPVHPNISISIPQFPSNIDLSSLTIKQLTEAAEEVLSNLTDQLMDTNQIRSVVVDAPYMQTIKNLIRCNFTQIQTCEGRHSLFWSAVQSLIVVLMLGIMGRVLDVPYIDALLVIAFVPIFMYLTYGYSLTCIPLIPTCLMRDLFEIADYLLPEELDWPDELVDFPGCRSASCMRSCISDSTIGFRSWQDHLAWVMCETNPEWSMGQCSKFPSDDPLRLAILRKCTAHHDSMRSAQRICFSVTLVRSIPFIFIILITIWLLPTVVGIGTAAVQFILNTLFIFVLFVHAEN